MEEYVAGDIVKVILYGESFWVKICEVHEVQCIGGDMTLYKCVVDNVLLSKKMSFGDEITILEDDIIYLYKS